MWMKILVVLPVLQVSNAQNFRNDVSDIFWHFQCCSNQLFELLNWQTFASKVRCSVNPMQLRVVKISPLQPSQLELL
jgi:hypothetical protein